MLAIAAEWQHPIYHFAVQSDGATHLTHHGLLTWGEGAWGNEQSMDILIKNLKDTLGDVH